MIKAIVYDLDDTLFPEESFRTSGFQFVADYLTGGGFPTTRQDIEAVYAAFPRTCFDELVRTRGLPFTAGELVTLFKEHEPTINPYPEVVSVLEELKKTYQLGIITDYHHKTQQNKVEALNIKHYFSHVLFTDAMGTKKPDTAPFEKMKELMGCKEGEIVYVGDNEQKDFIGARAAGYHTIRYKSHGVYKDVALEAAYKADFEIENHKDLFSVLASLT